MNLTKNDRMIGIVILLLALGMFYQAVTFEYPDFDLDPGPAFLPIVYSVALFFCALGIIFLPRKAKVEKEEDEAAASVEDSRGNMTRMIVIFVAFLLYVTIFKAVGFVLSTIIFLMFAFLYLAKARNTKLILTSLIISIATTGAIYYVMKVQLSIQLPKGIFLI